MPHVYSSFRLRYSLPRLWSTRSYNEKHLPKLPHSGTEPKYMWLVKRLPTTEHLLHIHCMRKIKNIVNSFY